MRILINAVTVSPHAPGNWAHLCNLLEGWKEAGTSDRILLAAHPLYPRDAEAALSGLVEVRRAALGRVGVLATQHVRLARLARDFDAQAVLNATPVAASVRRVRLPQVTVVHDMRHAINPDEFGTSQIAYRKLVYHPSILRSDAVIAISEGTRHDILAALRISPDCIHVVAHGADHVDRWRRGSPGTHGIAFAHWTNKRPDIALRTWAILREVIPGFERRLEIVGARGTLRQALEVLVAELGLDDLVHLHGYLPDPAYQELFSSASVVLLPSTLEGFGLPVIEGLRLGIPVVASAGAGIEYAGADAALYADGNARSFAAHCRRLFTDSAWRRQVVARGVEHASTHTWKATALSTRDVLRDALLAREAGCEPRVRFPRR